MSTKKEPQLPDLLSEPVIPEAALEPATAEGIILILDELRRRAHARYWTTKRRSIGNMDPVLRTIGARIATLDDTIAAVSAYLSAGTAGAGAIYRHAKVVNRCPRCRARARLNPDTVGKVRKSPTPKVKKDDQTVISRPYELPADDTVPTEIDDLPF